MCGRFVQAFTWPDLVEIYGVVNPIVPDFQPSWNVAPAQDIGVVVPVEKNRVFRAMRWGLVPSWSKDESIGGHLINARVETAAEKPAFRAAWKTRRCVIPASGYYEWKEQSGGKKQPFYITREDGHLISFAGLWELWHDELLSVTILTTEAGDVTREIHERMPVILDGEAVDDWLKGTDPESVADAQLTFWPVSPAINRPSFNSPAVLERWEEGK